MNKSIVKDAQKDAAEYMMAQMFYGEGAGTRRKHIASAVAYKTERVDGYARAFDQAMKAQDPTVYIKKAKRTRRTKDISDYTSRNVRAIARGDRSGMSGLVSAVFITATVAHVTGYDKIILEKTKVKTQEFRQWLKRKL